MDSSRGRLRNQVVSSLVWLWWVINLARFEFEFRTVSLFYLYLCFVWRITLACLLVCWWQVRYSIQRRGSWSEYETRCRGPGMVAHVWYSVTGRLRSWVALCTVCTMHVETRSAGFLVEPQNQGKWFIIDLFSKSLGRFVSGLTSKPLGRFFPVWPQNWWRRFSSVLPQNRCLKFPGLGIKTGSYSLMI
jgi:hypothetical protein